MRVAPCPLSPAAQAERGVARSRVLTAPRPVLRLPVKKSPRRGFRGTELARRPLPPGSRTAEPSSRQEKCGSPNGCWKPAWQPGSALPKGMWHVSGESDNLYETGLLSGQRRTGLPGTRGGRASQEEPVGRSPQPQAACSWGPAPWGRWRTSRGDRAPLQFSVVVRLSANLTQLYFYPSYNNK